MLRIFYALLSLVLVAIAAKLNVPRILLPIFRDLSTNFTLEATDGGCYTWNTTRPDIIDLQPFDPQQKCSNKILVVTSIRSKITLRTTAIILAEEIDTKQILYCDVIVDVIDSLQIVTKTHELFIEEAPEAFQVRAYDTQGNEFSTLDGIEFQWSIVPDATAPKAAKQPVLRFIKFMDSSYETPASIVEFERNNRQGDMVLLEGVKTGSAKVMVKLVHIDYNRLNGTEVSLVVVANLLLEPANVFVTRGDIVTYRIYHVHQGRLEIIRFPSQQYYLEAEDGEIVRAVGTSGGAVAALRDGRTRVFLRDRNVLNSELESSTKKPAAWIAVVRPYRIDVVLWPQFNWVAIKGHDYVLSIEMFTENNEKMQIGSKVMVNVQVSDEQKFVLKTCASNGSWCHGFANEPGEIKVRARLEHVASEHLAKPLPFPEQLTATATIRIYDELRIRPYQVILPSHETDRAIVHDVPLKVTGGDGKFTWTSNDTTIGTVTQAGVVRVSGGSSGVFSVAAAMQSNTRIRALARFYVVPVSSLKIDSSKPDVAVQATLNVNVFMFTDSVNGTRLPVSDCARLPFRVAVTDDLFVFNETVSSDEPDSCAVIRLRAIGEGRGDITVSYKLNDGYEIVDTLRLSAFKSLRLVPRAGLVAANGSRTESVLVLAAHTAVDLVIVDGPQKVLPDDQLERLVETGDGGLIDVVAVAMESDRNVVRVGCRAGLGSEMFEFAVVNERTQTRDSVRVRVECVEPHSLMVTAKESACPHLSAVVEHIIDVSVAEVMVELGLKDSQGRILGNVTGFEFGCELDENGKRLALIAGKTQDMAGQKFLRVQLLGQVGRFQLIVWLSPQRKLVARLSLRLVDRVRVRPQTASLFNSHANRMRIEIEDGSGYFRVQSEPADIVSVQFRNGDRAMLVQPLRTGHVRITVRDLCSAVAADARVAVVAIDRIRIEGMHMVQVGERIELLVRFYDVDDCAVFVPDLAAIRFKTNVFESDLIAIKIVDLASTDKPIDHVRLEIQALRLGETKIQAEAVQNEPQQSIKSSVFNIQIHAPLRIAPKSLTLVISATYQLELLGGPQIDSNIKFECDRFEGSLTAPVSIAPNGVVTAVALGVAYVSASVMDSADAVTRPSFDSVRIEVVALKAIRIVTPVKRVVRDSMLPIGIRPVPDTIDELAFGAIAMSCHWQISDLNVLEMFGSFDTLNVRYARSDSCFGRVQARNPGRSVVKLSVTVDERLLGVENGGDNRTLETYTELEVIDSLRLVTDDRVMVEVAATYNLLLTPDTNYQLATNKDRLASTKLTYRIWGLPTNVTDQLSTNDATVATVSTQGLVQTSATIGKCVLLIEAFDSTSALLESRLILIEVKPISYLVAVTSAAWTLGTAGEPVGHRVPLGADINYGIAYFDNFGQRFTRTNAQPSVRCNRRDLIALKSTNHGTRFMTSAQHVGGKTVLKIGTVDGSMAAKAHDFIVIDAEQSLRPFLANAVIGDVICFATNIIGVDRGRGQWHSGDSRVLNIDSDLGLAQVIGTQLSPVTIHHSLAATASLHLNLLPVTQISIVPDTYTITDLANDVVQVPVVLAADGHRPYKNFFDGGNRQCRDATANTTVIASPFLCYLTFVSPNSLTYVDVTKMFRTQARFTWQMGHFCEIKVRPQRELSRNATGINDHLLLQVHYVGFSVAADTTALTNVSYELRAAIEIDFHPAIYLYTATGLIGALDKETDKWSQHVLELDDELLSGRLFIVGQQKIVDRVRVTVVNDNENRVRIGTVERLGPLKHTVTVRSTGLLVMATTLDQQPYILVESPITKQSFRIGLRTTTSKCTLGSYGSPLLDTFASFGLQSSFWLLLIIAVLTALFYAYTKWRDAKINSSVSINDSMFNDSSRTNSLDQYRTRFLFTPHNRSTSSASSSARVLCYGDDSLNVSRF